MKRTVICGCLMFGIVTPLLRADEILDQQLKEDVVLRALADELQRNQEGLKLADLARPYYIEYSLNDSATGRASATLGAITGHNTYRYRYFNSSVRVGSYQLDNTNFGGGGNWWDYGYINNLAARGWGGGGSVPIENDYNAIRQALWLNTDNAYKDAAETLVQKKTFMEQKLIEDKPDDFIRVEPAVYFEEYINPTVDLEPLEKIVLPLSEVFKNYPEIIDSGAGIFGGCGNQYLVNTEGTRIRTKQDWYQLRIWASVQADDGMPFSDTLEVYTGSLDRLPPAEELASKCRELAERLIAVKKAPLLESYSGPVLMDAKPAAAAFAAQFAHRFSGGQRPVGSSTDPDDFENKIGNRILPRFLDVVDDATLEKIDDQELAGHYVYDDEGVKVQKVTLVEKGKLQRLLMSRNPSRKFKESTGHGRNGVSIGCLMVTSSEGTDDAELKKELLGACADEGLEFGLRISALNDSETPLAMFKVFPDGHEEMVRGAQISDINLKAFKRLLAVGNKPQVLNNYGWGSGSTIAAPAMLFEELDLAKIDSDFDKPPIIPSPLAREKN